MTQTMSRGALNVLFGPAPVGYANLIAGSIAARAAVERAPGVMPDTERRNALNATAELIAARGDDDQAVRALAKIHHSITGHIREWTPSTKQAGVFGMIAVGGDAAPSAQDIVEMIVLAGVLDLNRTQEGRAERAEIERERAVKAEESIAKTSADTVLTLQTQVRALELRLRARDAEFEDQRQQLQELLKGGPIRRAVTAITTSPAPATDVAPVSQEWQPTVRAIQDMLSEGRSLPTALHDLGLTTIRVPSKDLARDWIKLGVLKEPDRHTEPPKPDTPPASPKVIAALKAYVRHGNSSGKAAKWLAEHDQENASSERSIRGYVREHAELLTVITEQARNQFDRPNPNRPAVRADSNRAAYGVMTDEQIMASGLAHVGEEWR